MDQDTVNERIAHLKRAGVNAAAEARIIAAEGTLKPNVVDATVREPAGLKPEPVVEVKPAPDTTPHMLKSEVDLSAIPDHMPPFVELKFRTWWAKGYVRAAFPDGKLESGWPQPTAEDYRAWRARDIEESSKPNPLAHAITVADAPPIDWSAVRGQGQSSPSASPAAFRRPQER